MIHKVKGLKVICVKCGKDLLKEYLSTFAPSTIYESKICEIIRDHKTLFHDANIRYVSDRLTEQENSKTWHKLSIKDTFMD